MNYRLTGILLTGVAAAMFARAPTSPTSTVPPLDTRLVYCLADAREQAMTEAAVDLGLAERSDRRGRVRVREQGQPVDLSLAAWRRDYPSQFERTCSALLAADSASGGRATGTAHTTTLTFAQVLNVLLPTMLGAVLALASSQWGARRERARASASVLRTQAQLVRRAATEYTRAWLQTATGTPSADTLHGRLDELESKLNEVQSVRSQWNFVKQLTDKLSDDLFTTEPVSGWPSVIAERQQKSAEVNALFKNLEADVNIIADAIENPISGRAHMRKRQPSSVT